MLNRWLDSDAPEGRALLASASLTAADLPAVITPRAILRRATTSALASELGLSAGSRAGHSVDLTVIGAGPAGLAAAVTNTMRQVGAVMGVAVLGALVNSHLTSDLTRRLDQLGVPRGMQGLVTGDIDEMLSKHVGALFMPHGLGHLLVSAAAF